MDVYQIVTDRIIGLLEKGTIPWRKPWAAGSGMPKNIISNKEYRGINVFLLSAMPYSSPYWLTYKQAQDLGGHVRKGEKSSMVVFWKMLDKADDEEAKGQKGKIPLLRYYQLFSVEQCEGVSVPPEPDEIVNPFTPIERAEQIITDYKNRPSMHYGGNRAFYRPLEDRVQMPHEFTFEQNELFYSVLFHEFGHSTGAVHRLARKEVMEFNAFGSESYAAEELVADMCSAFLCGHAGISNQTIDLSASYIDGWLSVLRKDKRMVIAAAAKAQAAADWVLGRTLLEEDRHEQN